VGVRFSGTQSVVFERSVLADLEAGLARSNVRVCPRADWTGQASAAGGAELEVDSVTPQLVAVRVQLRGQSGEARLDRQVDLAQVPMDSRAFAVALVADELLRAGWAELDGNDDAVPITAAPEVTPSGVPAALEDVPAAAGGREASAPVAGGASLGVRAALENFRGGLTLWGADVALLLPLGARWALQLAPGIRTGVEVSAPHGSVESRALSVATNVRYRLPLHGWGLAAGAGLQGAGIELQGAASDADTEASRYVGVALYAQALLAASVPITGPLWLELGGTLGAPLLALEGTDDGRTAAAASGLQLGASLALLLQL